MRRREFIALLGVATASLPLAARAQQGGKVSRIGYLGSSSPSLEPHYVEAFRRKLRDLGHVEGENIVIEYRWGEGQDDRLPNLAIELVGLKPDVIVTTGTPGGLAAMQATRTIPIVMASSADPVSAGLITSLARPAGNVTGFTILGAELEGKRLEFLKRAIPALARAAVIWNPNNPAIVSYFETLKNAAAPALGITLDPIAEVRRVEELDSAFAAIASARPQALVVVADRFLLSHRKRIVEFAAANRLSSMYPYREYVDAGGLMSFAQSTTELFRGAATYVDKILKGAKPGDLPSRNPRFELIINLKTANMLGIEVPALVLQLADEVIE
jgi:putative ABC transport system substrate-binding protein